MIQVTVEILKQNMISSIRPMQGIIVGQETFETTYILCVYVIIGSLKKKVHMLNNIRIEEDLLGTREVPADAYYGVHTLRAIENFYISNNKISDIPEFVRGMVMVKKAAALANKELQTIPKSVANAIIAACDEVLNNGKCMDQFPVDVYQGGAGKIGRAHV